MKCPRRQSVFYRTAYTSTRRRVVQLTSTKPIQRNWIICITAINRILGGLNEELEKERSASKRKECQLKSNHQDTVRLYKQRM
jgi:hypothetical protein